MQHRNWRALHADDGGVRSRWHSGTSAGTAFLYVLEGELSLSAGEKEYVLARRFAFLHREHRTKCERRYPLALK